MSYAIEYGRQFIRSEEGITPCWLSGDNNVTEFRNGRERRERHWSCFCGFVGATEEDITTKVRSMLGGYQEHWKRHNKWVDDESLLRWVSTGIKKSASVEDILKRNPDCCGSIRCCVHVWRRHDHTIEEQVYVRTTAEFDSWIRRWRALKERLAEEKAEGYPCIDFGTENIRSPIVAEDTDLFCFKKKGRYLSELTECSCKWTKDASSAKLFSYEEAIRRLNGTYGIALLGDASLTRAPKETENMPKAIIMIVNADGDRDYVYKATAHKLKFSQYKEHAYQYSSLKTAQAAAKKILDKYSQIQHAEVIVL